MPNIDTVFSQKLTGAQQNAALDTNDEILCLACAGSGKSRTLAYRIARLIAEGVDPKSIVAFTFTEKAAESIKQRIASALESLGMPVTLLGAIYIGTIHSYCQNLLGQIDSRFRQFDVLDDNRLYLYLLSRYSELGIKQIKDAKGKGQFKTIREIASAWKILNDEGLDIDELSNEDPIIGGVLKILRNSFLENQYIDFSTMIRAVVDALEDEVPTANEVVGRISHLLVDEYQDVNPVQELLISNIRKRGANLFVVGDDDQAIYSWRGADISNILSFADRYSDASIHTLSVNYRSTEAIVASADEFAAATLGPTRHSKEPSAANNLAPRDFRKLWFDSTESEAEWVASQICSLIGTSYIEPDTGESRGLTPADFAILMRSTVGSGDEPRHRPFTQALLAKNINVSIENGGRPFDRPQVWLLQQLFELLRDGNPSRAIVKDFFDTNIPEHYPNAEFSKLANVLAFWGDKIHAPAGGTRQRIYPQTILQELLAALGMAETNFADGTLQDIGVFSRIMQDVETVYMSVDSSYRFQTILNFLGNIAEDGYDSGSDIVVQKPDAVSVLTVHKAKGLEFPVVFVVDTEQGRFPGRKNSYSGWIPSSVLQPALDRGAYQSTKAEDARAYYTAITRAERFLYISASEYLPGGKQKRKPSEFTLRLGHSEILEDIGVPEGLTPEKQIRRIDENIVPTSFSEIRYYLRCPYDYKLRKICGFSPAITEMFGFGQTVHAAISKLHETHTEIAPSKNDAENIADDIFHLKHIPPSSNPETNPGGYEAAKNAAKKISGEYAEQFSTDFEHQRQVEVRFEIPAHQTVIAGTIDLLLQEDNENNILNAAVIDFKAMEGGKSPLDNTKLDWSELSLQVQLYALAADEVLGENAKTGHVHLLKDQTRVDVPIDETSIENAVKNVEWAINGILRGDYPARPHKKEKCDSCDFNTLCHKQHENFQVDDQPPPISIPNGKVLARAFSQTDA